MTTSDDDLNNLLGGKIASMVIAMAEELHAEILNGDELHALRADKQMGDTLHEGMIESCVEHALAIKSGEPVTGMLCEGGLLFMSVGERGQLVTLPARRSVATKDLRQLMRWVMRAYEPIGYIGGAFRVAEMGVTPTVELKCNGCGKAHVPAYVVLTMFGMENAQLSRTTYLDETGRHHMESKLLAGGDPYLTALFDDIFFGEEDNDDGPPR